MRKTLLCVATTALALTTAPAASAATSRVDGDNFATGSVRLVSQGCLDPGAEQPSAPTFAIARGPRKPPLGTRSIGWTPRASGYGVGPSVHVDSPSTMTQASMRVFATSARASGQVIVNYSPPGDSGEWRGRSALGADTSVGWHGATVTNATYQWRHFSSSGTADQDAANASLTDFVSSHGGDGSGAWIGFIYGCDGNPFFIDGLAITTADGTDTFDFEGYRTKSLITKGSKTPKSVTITYGQKVGLTAKLRRAVGDKALAGRLKLDSKPASAKKWSKHEKLKVGKGGKDFTVKPTHSWAYRTSYAGTTKFEASHSSVLKVLVRSKVAAHLTDASVTKGKTFTATGRVLPKRSATVLLQRYVHKHWKTVKRGKAAKDGAFRLSSVANTLGVSYWRVAATSGGGNLANESGALKLKAQAPPPPPPPPGGGGGDNPPPPEEPPPPPPPPPSH